MRHTMPPDGQTKVVDLPFQAGTMLTVRSLGPSPLGGRPGEEGGRLSHCHTFGQFYYLTEGLIVVETEGGRLLSLPRQLGWIPPFTAHQSHRHGRLSGWAAYVPADYCDDLPPEPAVLDASALTPLILERLESLTGAERQARYEHLVQVFMDEVKAAKPISIGLPYPSDPRLMKITDFLLKNLGDKRSIREWGQEAGFSERNLARRFSSETGLSLARWRRLARILRGREMLAEGRPVQEAAWSLGYENVSAFIEQFKLVFVRTPGLVISRQGGGLSRDHDAGDLRDGGPDPRPGP